MKKNLHPQYNSAAVITCNSCKSEHVLGSTLQSASIEVCSNCHPHYTGKQNEVFDEGNRINDFKKKLEQKRIDDVIKKRKKVATRNKKTTEISAGPKLTLHDMLKQANKN